MQVDDDRLPFVQISDMLRRNKVRERFNQPDLEQECTDWCKEFTPDLEQFRMAAFFGERGEAPSFLVQMDNAGSSVDLHFSVKAPMLLKDQVEAQVRTVLAMRLALRRVSKYVKQAGPPPPVEFTDEEKLWIETHGEPTVRMPGLQVTVLDFRDPQRPPEEEVFRPFDAWSLLPGGKRGTPVRNLRRELRHVAKDWKPDAMAALRGLVDAWFEGREKVTGGACLTDSEASFAAWAMCQGKHYYDHAIQLPEEELEELMEQDWDFGDGEDVLMLIDWVG